MNDDTLGLIIKSFIALMLILGLVSIISYFLIMPVGAYPRVPQGGTVYLNETLDISGVAAGYSNLVYINQYSTDLSPANWTITTMINMPDTKEGYYNFTIDPEFFGNKLGWWYRYNGIYEPNSNNRAFYIRAERPLPNYTPNETERAAEFFPPPPPVVPERKVSDYLVARGDPFNATFNNWSKASAWIFGRINGIYDRKVENGTSSYNASEIQGLEPGSYVLMYYSPGVDRQFDIRITNDTLKYYDYNDFEIKIIDLKPLSPMVVLDRLRSIAGMNDDNFTTYKLEVQEPQIEITSLDTIITDRYNQTGVIQVRGYTNLANRTPLTFVLDEDRVPQKMLGQSRMQNSWNSTVLAVENPGSMRYFDYSIPLWLGQMNPGMHNVTVFGPYDTKMETSFWVYDLPEGSPFRNQTIRYVGGNEWKPAVIQTVTVVMPTPTPEIITNTVKIEVTPPEAVTRAIQDDIIKGYVFTAIIIGVLFIFAVFVSKWLYGVWKRSGLE